MKRVLLLLPLFCTVAFSKAYAAGLLSSLRPRLADYGADLVSQFNYTKERDYVEIDNSVNRGTSENESKFRESIDFRTVGYVYHPNLFVFTANGSGLLQQQRISNRNNRVSRKSQGSNTYDLWGEFLRKKDYRAEVYLRNEKPFENQGGGITTQSEIKSSGVQLYYETEEWQHSLEYLSEQHIDSAFDRKDDNYISRFQYRTPKLTDTITDFRTTLSARHDVQETDDNTTKKNTFSFNNSLRYREDARFTTTASQRTNDSDKSKRTLSILSERFILDLPWNFRFDSQAKQERNTTDFKNSTDDTIRQLEQFDLSLQQRLFRSLDSRASFLYGDNTSTQGSFRQKKAMIESNYTKRLRGGSIFARVSSQMDELKREGTVFTEEELHSAVLVTAGITGGTFQLNELDTDETTIIVEVKHPVTGQWQPLDNADWSVSNPGQIQLDIKVNDSFTAFSGTNTYDFRVTYTSNPADYVLQANTSLFNGSIGLFDGFFRGDFDHSYTSQEIIEGNPNVFELAPTVIEDVFGVTFVKDPFKVFAEYSILESEYQENKWTFDVDYLKTFAPLPKLSSTVTAHYDRSEADIRQLDGTEGTSKEYSYLGDLSSSTVLPVLNIPIKLSHNIGYLKNVGEIPRFQRLSDGTYRLISSTDKDEDKYYTALGVNFSVPVPRTRARINFRGSYDYENDSAGIEESTLKYALSTGYRWGFGATFLSINGRYYWDQVDKKSDGVHSVNTSGEASLLVKLTRTLL